MKARKPRKLYTSDRRKLMKLMTDYGFAMLASGVWRQRLQNLDPHFPIPATQKSADALVAETADLIHKFLEAGTR